MTNETKQHNSDCSTASKQEQNSQSVMSAEPKQEHSDHFFLLSGKKCSPISRIVAGIFLIPASMAVSSGVKDWMQNLRGGQHFFGGLLDRPQRVTDALTSASYCTKIIVCIPLNIAVALHKKGGLQPSFDALVHICKTEGFAGISRRLLRRIHSRVAQNMSQSEDDMRIASSKVLVVDYRIPKRDVSAGERATWGILLNLKSLGYDVTFLPSDMLYDTEYAEELRKNGITVITSRDGYLMPTDFLCKYGSDFGLFYLIRMDVSENVLQMIRTVSPRAKVLFHAPDIYHIRETREAELLHDESLIAQAMNTKERELTIMCNTDFTIVISENEKALLKKEIPHVPMGVFPGLYAPIVAHPEPFENRKDIFFLGGFTHNPNTDAVLWFCKEIWPLIHAQLPEVCFHIVGSNPPPKIQELALIPGVVCDGFIKNITPLLSSIRLGVAPLRYGAGIKGKVAMTFGAGVPCICTTIAAEGMNLENGMHTFIEDDPKAFADAVVKVYTQPELWQSMSEQSRQHVENLFSEEANRRLFTQILWEQHVLPIDLWTTACATQEPSALPVFQDSVDVSIIIPVYNKWELTQACINSILMTSGNRPRYEIILADDGSSDETTSAEQVYPGLVRIRTPQNLGFLRNCNNAARHARGRHILLLNNDTIVFPNWLASLYELMESDPEAAIIGSKIIYPSGEIQEAGGIIWNDGTCSNYGRGESYKVKQCQFVREADYITGASILVRGSFWREIGGFDERYENAYCEDCDLAMTARAHGLRVLYQPKSELIHFEHQSYVADASDSHSRLQAINTQKMREKWADTFAKDHLPPTSEVHQGMSHACRSLLPAGQARRAKGERHVLYFSPFPSHPTSAGNAANITQFGRELQSRGYTVHFALLKSVLYQEKDLDLMRNAWDTFDLLDNSHPLLAEEEVIPFDSWFEIGLGEQIVALCKKYDIDMVFCSYVFQSKMLEYIPGYILKVIDTHDKMSNRYEMLRQHGQPIEFFSCTPEEEGAYLRRADVVIARRDEESAYFNSISGKETAITIPYFEKPRFIDKNYETLQRVGMIASANTINLAMTLEFLAAVEKTLDGKICPFTVEIAGNVQNYYPSLSRAEKRLLDLPWVRLLGFVPDIHAFYASQDILVSPVTMGTGINVKTVQAMAYGVPLLTTQCGSKGTESTEPLHLHPDATLEPLVASLFELVSRPQELNRLAAVSKELFTTFYAKASKGFDTLLAHSKLR